MRWIVLALALFSLLISQISGFRMLQLQAWWSGLLFYMAGYALAPLIRDRLFSLDLRNGPSITKKIAVLGLAMIAAAIVTHFVALWNLGCPIDPRDTCGSEQLYGRFIVRMISGNYGFVPLFLLSSASGMLFFMLVSILVTALPERIVGWLCWVGRNSLSLLLLNGFFLYLGNRVIQKSFAAGYPEWMPWVLPFVVLAGHLLVLPLVTPAVNYAERLSKRIATALVGHVTALQQGLRSASHRRLAPDLNAPPKPVGRAGKPGPRK